MEVTNNRFEATNRLKKSSHFFIFWIYSAAKRQKTFRKFIKQGMSGVQSLGRNLSKDKCFMWFVGFEIKGAYFTCLFSVHRLHKCSKLLKFGTWYLKCPNSLLFDFKSYSAYETFLFRKLFALNFEPPVWIPQQVILTKVLIFFEGRKIFRFWPRVSGVSLASCFWWLYKLIGIPAFLI